MEMENKFFNADEVTLLNDYINGDLPYEQVEDLIGKVEDLIEDIELLAVYVEDGDKRILKPVATGLYRNSSEDSLADLTKSCVEKYGDGVRFTSIFRDPDIYHDILQRIIDQCPAELVLGARVFTKAFVNRLQRFDDFVGENGKQIFSFTSLSNEEILEMIKQSLVGNAPVNPGDNDTVN